MVIIVIIIAIIIVIIITANIKYEDSIMGSVCVTRRAAALATP